jgi:predicted ABC-type ATPase
MIYLWLPSVDMALQRVKFRIRQGGHAIPEETVRRSYASGLSNAVAVYLPLVDMAIFLDNSDAMSRKLKVIAEKEIGADLRIYTPSLWENILAMTERRKI